MRKMIGYLCNVNKKTKGGFFIFTSVLIGITVSIVGSLNDVLLLPWGDLRELSGFGDYFGLIIINMVILLCWTFVIGFFGSMLYWVWEWMRDDLFYAFKEAAKEDYNYKEKKSGTVKFK